jgi:hypothetical protein
MTILMTFDPSPTEIGDRVAVSAETYSITTTGRYESKENAAYQMDDLQSQQAMPSRRGRRVRQCGERFVFAVILLEIKGRPVGSSRRR